MADHDFLFKLLLVGDSAVGKSSLVLRFVDDTFEEDTAATIGLDFKVTFLKLQKKRVKLTIWDTGGQERFRTLTSSYYRNAQGIILVYDVSRPETFKNVEAWLEEVETYCPTKDVVKMLVANKIDRSDRVISREQGTVFARQHGMLFIETSAKTRDGVRQAFEELVQKIVDTPDLHPAQPASGISLTPSSQSQPAPGGCVC
eukprot:TRINITY_DN479_c0_g1_i2.p1 TRINITY_DN479_c0_g1~~TRINITY_DN479_c0_g1_i2.p1  ORF type:complete len:201 (+),score=13.06 TRINITY_DN479_c0_g1_i2:43-645(+)